MTSYNEKAAGFGKKVADGAKKAAKAAEVTGRKIVKDNPRIGAGAAQMKEGAKEIGKGVAEGLVKEASAAVSKHMAARDAAKEAAKKGAGNMDVQPADAENTEYR